MIVNKYSVLMLFMAGLGLALAGALVGTALWAAWRISASRGEQATSAAERSVHLATLVAVVCLVILVIGWPLLYAMLGSFVPEIPGAMCIYGVTRVMPVAAALVQAAQPVAVFLLGGWLLLESVRRQSGHPPRRPWGMLALATVGGLVVFAHGAEIHYVLNMNSLNEVSCCSRYGEAGSSRLQAPAYYLPWFLPGPALRVVLNTLFFAALPLLALWLLARSRRRTFRRRRLVLVDSAVLLATSVGLGLASLSEFSEVIAPLLMRLPFHHCLYCFMASNRVPDACLMVANLTIGCFAAGWAAVLGAALQMGSPAPSALLLHRRVCMVAATALSACVLMVIIHLVVPHG